MKFITSASGCLTVTLPMATPNTYRRLESRSAGLCQQEDTKQHKDTSSGLTRFSSNWVNGCLSCKGTPHQRSQVRKVTPVQTLVSSNQSCVMLFTIIDKLTVNLFWFLYVKAMWMNFVLSKNVNDRAFLFTLVITTFLTPTEDAWSHFHSKFKEGTGCGH